METTTTEAASPASNTGDGTTSGNVSLGQAAAMLFAKEQKVTPTPTEAPANTADDATTADTAETTEQSTGQAETAPESSDAETPSQPEAEEEAAEKDVPSNKPSSDKESRIRDKVQKRVDEEVAKRKVLEERLAALETSLKKAETEKANPPPPMPKGTMPLSEFNDLQSLKQYHEQAKQAARWAKDQLTREDLGEGVQVGEQVLNREQIRDVLRKAEIALEDLIPQRSNFLVAKSQASRQAAEAFPFLTDPNSVEYQMAVQAYRSNPWLQDLPNADFIVGVQVEGLKALQARSQAASKPKSEKSKPKTIPAAKPAGDQTAVSSGTSSSRVPTQTVAKNSLEAAREKLRAKGAVTAGEAAALLQRSEQLRNLR